MGNFIRIVFIPSNGGKGTLSLSRYDIAVQLYNVHPLFMCTYHVFYCYCLCTWYCRC